MGVKGAEEKGPVGEKCDREKGRRGYKKIFWPRFFFISFFFPFQTDLSCVYENLWFEE